MHGTRYRTAAAELIGVLLVVAGCGAHSDAARRGPVVAYTNANCFDGTAFAPCRLFVAGDRFVEPVANPDSVVDLAGRWVVAPFGEAHNHNIEASGGLDDVVAAYRRDGVLYVQNPNSLPSARAALAGRDSGAWVPDVTFANGGLTGPGGHPSQIAEANISRGRWSAADGEGAFHHTVADAAALDAAWRALLATKPDFVKLYLLQSDRYAERLADTSTIGWRGLDPALLPDVIRRADAAGLRVAAHVETAADFRAAVRAGVDMIAHLPGFRGDERTALADAAPYILTPDDAREAAERGVAVITTIAGLARYADAEGDSALRQAADGLNARNLTLLRDAGVRLGIGSDEYDGTSAGEARYLAALGVFTPAEVLRIWSVTTPQVIFPERLIGRLTPGSEASFLVLDGDPLAEFDAVGRIGLFVVRGRTVAR